MCWPCRNHVLLWSSEVVVSHGRIEIAATRV